MLSVSRSLIEKKVELSNPLECKFRLSGNKVRNKCTVLEELYNKNKVLDHGIMVGKELAYVLSDRDTDLDKVISEDQMFKLELDSFMKLIETEKTQQRILHTR